MTLWPEFVTEWIDSFPISTNLSNAMENLYMDHSSAPQPKHKEGGKRRALDASYNEKIADELSKALPSTEGE